jgi:hypothetical protein
MNNDFLKNLAINISLPSSKGEWKNAIRDWKNKARVCLFWAGRVFRPMYKIRGVFSQHNKSKENRPFSFLRFCNEEKSYAYLECCYCGGMLDMGEPYFLELFTSNDPATNQYCKSLLERSTKRVSTPYPLEEVAACYCYAPCNTDAHRRTTETSKERSNRQRLAVINGGRLV